MHRANSPVHNVHSAKSPTSAVKIDWSRAGRKSRISGLKVCVELILKTTVKAHKSHARSDEVDLSTPMATLILMESVRAAATCAPAARTPSYSGLSLSAPCKKVPAPHGVSVARFKLYPTIWRAGNKTLSLAFPGRDLEKS